MRKPNEVCKERKTKMRSVLAFICAMLCLGAFPCAEEPDIIETNHAGDPRWYWNEEGECWQENSEYFSSDPFVFTVTAPVIRTIDIHTVKNDGTTAAVRKEVKLGEIEYAIGLIFSYESDDSLRGVYMMVDSRYPMITALDAQYGAVPLNVSMVYETGPQLKSYTYDSDQSHLYIDIEGGTYELTYVSEIFYNEDHEVLEYKTTSVSALYDFETDVYLTDMENLNQVSPTDG